ncbi:DUF2845 domain-containing protein [Pseudoxanthomonas composti]|uniref:DUF2845 domain-containing protein n=1 Tax=Pseudoxanthomonas composti TaxID=2137479 RepID=A0A4Q1JZH0_9GAMM|nr:DUF2845 domain-containing protein [Pseudoxanthomonas composti]RXR08557.1 DUF2845 domain-containing protein [Pseudoxanthomonas composti]
MRRRLLALTLCAITVSATAASARFGNRLVTTGDSAGKVSQVAGTPNRVVPLENKFSANIGERWEYDQERKTIQIVFRDGKVVDIQEVYD